MHGLKEFVVITERCIVEKPFARIDVAGMCGKISQETAPSEQIALLVLLEFCTSFMKWL
jgi:hypothetical protein